MSAPTSIRDEVALLLSAIKPGPPCTNCDKANLPCHSNGWNAACTGCIGKSSRPVCSYFKYEEWQRVSRIAVRTLRVSTDPKDLETFHRYRRLTPFMEDYFSAYSAPVTSHLTEFTVDAGANMGIIINYQ
ncbi:hypothetical protein C8R43DRAFT_1123449 [Mycena crocata]|nr:hypothetical protein C8R43DRAFT_1123449 [Mycena crocata]